MEISQLDLLALLLYSVPMGAAIALLYELFKTVGFVLRLMWLPGSVSPPTIFGKTPVGLAPRAKPPKRIAVIAYKTLRAVGDTVFMILAAVGLIILSYACNAGRRRWMLYVGVVFGFFLFKNTFGKLMGKCLTTVTLALAKLLSVATRAVVGRAKKIKRILSENIKSKSNRKNKRRKSLL